MAIALWGFRNIPLAVRRNGLLMPNVTVVDTPTGASALNANSLTFPYTVTLGDCLVVGAGGSGSGMSITSITFNGVALTVRKSRGVGTNAFVELHRLVAPATGTHDVVVTYAGGPGNVVAGAISLAVINQTTPDTQSSGGTGTSSNPNTSEGAVSSATGELVVDCSVGRVGASSTPGSGQTEQVDIANAADNNLSMTTAPGAPSVTMSETFAVSDLWALVAVAFKPAAPPSDPLMGAMMIS
jgi:hypothetical protein